MHCVPSRTGGLVLSRYDDQREARERQRRRAEAARDEARKTRESRDRGGPPAERPPAIPFYRRYGWPSIRTLVAAVVTVVWAVSYSVSIFDPRFTPNPAITSVMLLVVGYLFVTERRGRNGR